MSQNTWVDTVLRFARGRADQMWHADSPRHTPDYDIPAFIRRGIRIPALDAFHADLEQARKRERDPERTPADQLLLTHIRG